MNASTDFAHTVSSGRWFQQIVVSTKKKLFLYCVALLSGIIILLVLLQTHFSRIFVSVGFRFDGSLRFIESDELLNR